MTIGFQAPKFFVHREKRGNWILKLSVPNLLGITFSIIYCNSSTGFEQEDYEYFVLKIPSSRGTLVLFSPPPVYPHRTRTMKQLSSSRAGELPELGSVSHPLRGVLTTERTSQTFLQPTYPLYTASISAAKHYLDSLACSIHEEQTANREKKGRKRKRSENYRGSLGHHIQLQELHVDGFTIGQVWEQAKRVLESSEAAVECDLTRILTSDTESAQLSDRLQDDAGHVELEEGSIPDDDDEISGADGGFGYDVYDGDSNGKERHGGSESPEMQSDAENTLAGKTSTKGDSRSGGVHAEILVRDRYGLNDGFFSIDDFNRQTEILEKQDARGSPDADAASDEEDVDWGADPATTTDQAISAGQSKFIRGGSLSGDDQHSDEPTDDDGPTFGDADLDAASEFDEDASSSAEPEGDIALDNTNAIKYSDFFAPPSIKTDSKRLREHSSPAVHSAPRTGDIQKDIEVAMSDVRRDLFDSDESEEEGPDVKPDDPKSRQSTHEKVRAKLADEIRRLETANVSKRDWTLSGEAKAPERPLNSLIEEDLEFERVGKPVPVITNEVTEEIEDLVKRRVIAKEFDEVIRRHPDSLGSRGNSRRDAYQLDDTKPQQSLAELYETDHLRATDSSYVDPKDAKLKQEHLEISELWKNINSQLDTLSNWHYKPKTPQPNITVVSDVATVNMEDARPTAGRGVNGPGMLAPQEVYEPGNDGKPRSELTLKSGSSVAKHEMSREEKLRRRKREKQKMKKQSGNTSGPGASTRKDQLVSNLDKAGVKIIGKDGDTKDVYGRKAKSFTSKRGDELKL